MHAVSANDLRRFNRSRVLTELMLGDARSRPELAQHLGLSLMAVVRIVKELHEVGLIDEGEGRMIRSESPGRPAAELRVNSRGGYVLGFVINALEQSVTLSDLCGRQVACDALKHVTALDGEGTVLEFIECARRQMRAAGVDPLRVLGVGIATTGQVDRQRGVLVEAPYLGWAQIELARAVESSLGVPAVVDGTANTLLAAEWRVAEKSMQDALLFHIGFGIGCGVLIDGRIAKGATLNVGQFGHAPMGDKNRVCSCGARGCLNTVASGWAALADLGEIRSQVATAEEFQRYRPLLTELLSRADAGEETAHKALREAGRRFGEAVRVLKVTLDPARILLAGPAGKHPAFLEGAQDGAREDAGSLLASCEIDLRSAAASLALDEFVLSSRFPLERLRSARRREIEAAA